MESILNEYFTNLEDFFNFVMDFRYGFNQKKTNMLIFFSFIKNNNIKIIKFLLGNNFNPDNYKEKFYNGLYNVTPTEFDCIEYAFRFGSLEMVKLFYPFSKAKSDEKFIYYGILNRDLRLISFILDEFANESNFEKNYGFFKDSFECLCIPDDDVFGSESSIEVQKSINFFVDEVNRRNLKYNDDFFVRGFAQMLKHAELELLLKVFQKCSINLNFDLGTDFSSEFIFFHIMFCARHDFLEHVIDYFDFNVVGREDGDTILIYLCKFVYEDFPENLFEKVVSKSNILTKNNDDFDAIHFLREERKYKFLNILLKYY